MRTVLADRGYGNEVADQALARRGITDRVIPRVGRAAPVERTRAWRRRYRFRAGAEGRISGLKRRRGWNRSRLKGRAVLVLKEGRGSRPRTLATVSTFEPHPAGAAARQALRAKLARGERMACPWCGGRRVIQSWGDGSVYLSNPDPQAEVKFVPASELDRRRVADPLVGWRIQLYCENPACQVREFEIRALRY